MSQVVKMLHQRVQRSWRKNADELKALCTGQLPPFVFGRGWTSPQQPIPVFVFHDVQPDMFEAQLQFLQANQYATVDANEIEAAYRSEKQSGRTVALTFDDATWTFWTYVFPLLQKYHARAILFAVPGVVPDDESVYFNLANVWEGRCTLEELASRGQQQPLCTWRELRLMHKSGLVDIQSHSCTHSRVPNRPQVVDFLHPDFDTSFANVNIPLSSLDHPERPARTLRLGAPVFASTPLLSCQQWFCENQELSTMLTQHVTNHGGPNFFRRGAWREELSAKIREWPAQKLGEFHSPASVSDAVRKELVSSRMQLEHQLNKPVEHFCYPWYAGSAATDSLAAELGYRTLHYGPALSNPRRQTARTALRIRRLPAEYFFRLPGKGRESLWSVFGKRLVSRTPLRQTG